VTCNPILAIPRNSVLGDQTKTRRFEHPIEVTVSTCRPANFHLVDSRQPKIYFVLPSNSWLTVLIAPKPDKRGADNGGVRVVASAVAKLRDISRTSSETFRRKEREGEKVKDRESD